MCAFLLLEVNTADIEHFAHSDHLNQRYEMPEKRTVHVVALVYLADADGCICQSQDHHHRVTMMILLYCAVVLHRDQGGHRPNCRSHFCFDVCFSHLQRYYEQPS